MTTSERDSVSSNEQVIEWIKLRLSEERKGYANNSHVQGVCQAFEEVLEKLVPVESQAPTSKDVFWLLETKWGPHIHYFGPEGGIRSRGGGHIGTEPHEFTRDVNNATRFPTREAASQFLDWMQRNIRHAWLGWEVVEHEWVSPAHETCDARTVWEKSRDAINEAIRQAPDTNRRVLAVNALHEIAEAMRGTPCTDPPAAKANACQHDLQKPDTTVIVAGPYAARCSVCKVEWHLPHAENGSDGL